MADKIPTSAITSAAAPLRIDVLQPLNVAGQIGITFLPGKKGPRASYGYWNRDLDADLDVISRWAPTAIVTLVEDFELRDLKVEHLGDAVRARGITWYHLPIVDVSIPAAAFEKAWIAKGAEIRNRLLRGERIVVHCRGGLGRAGMIAARLLIELGEDAEAAIERVRAVRPGAIETSAQESYVRNIHAVEGVK